MEIITKYKYVILIALVVFGFVFYWFQIMPASIKKSCSWFTEIIPADAGITKEQAEVNKRIFIQECTNQKIQTPECYLIMRDSIERPPKLEAEKTREATESEYKTCLRQNGL